MAQQARHIRLVTEVKAARADTRLKRGSSMRANTVGLLLLATAGALVGLASGSSVLVLSLLFLCAGLALAVPVCTQHGVRNLVLVLMAVNCIVTPMNGLRLGPIAASDLFLVAAAPLIFGRQVLRRSASAYRYRHYRPFFCSLGIIIAGGAVSSIYAADVGSLLDLAKFLLSTIGLLAVFATWSPSREQVRLLLWLFVGGAAVSVAATTVVASPYSGRGLGLATHPNHLGFVSMMATGPALGLFLLGSRRAKILAGTGIIPALLWGVAVSGSRAALVGWLVVVLTVVVALWRLEVLGWAAVAASALFVVVTVGLVTVPGTDAFDRLFQPDSSVRLSDTERSEVREESLAQIRQSPVTGAGFKEARSAHSLYVQVWASAGVMGLAGLLMIAWRTALLIVRSCGRSLVVHHTRDPLVTCVTAGFLGYLVGGVGQNILWDRYVWLVLAMSLALLSAGRTDDHDVTPPASTLFR